MHAVFDRAYVFTAQCRVDADVVSVLLFNLFVLLFTKLHYKTVFDLTHNNDASQQQVHRFHKNN